MGRWRKSHNLWHYTIDEARVRASITDFEFWERLCWYIQEDCWAKIVPSNAVPDAYQPLLCMHDLALTQRQHWSARHLLPVYWRDETRLGRTYIPQGWKTHADWERRLTLIAHPDSAKLQAHWEATLRRWHNLYLSSNNDEETALLCRFCYQGAPLALPLSFMRLMNLADMPYRFHAPDCQLKALTVLVLPALFADSP